MARKRRKRAADAYFSFEQKRMTVDSFSKKSMYAAGALYHVSHPLRAFPAFAAALLKSKKHEWIVVAFEKNGNIESYWVNKGPDRNSVNVHLADDTIIQLAQGTSASTVLWFHNHPNAVLLPSQQDIHSAAHYSQLLNAKGMNLLDFVCGRGYFKEYYRSISDAFFPAQQFVPSIRSANSTSKWQNLKLHLERF